MMQKKGGVKQKRPELVAFVKRALGLEINEGYQGGITTVKSIG